MIARPFLAAALALTALTVAVRAGRPDGAVTLSIVGTTDQHGYVFPREGRGGLELFGGYVKNLRAARQADAGAVVLVDSGDTYQGGIESNLSEGALVVDAYNALGYAAVAFGNHEFEFGAVDTWDDRPPSPDLRGALKARARQARFPMLAANLHDVDPARPVAWDNVQPSVLIDAAGVKVGLIGVMTRDALSMTLAANIVGLSVSPLVPAIQREAERLRRQGAQVVVVASHAGGSCNAFATPEDLSSCDDRAEIFEVARQLPRGLVDAIAAGHTHANVAHVVNGVAIGNSLGMIPGTSRSGAGVTPPSLAASRDGAALAPKASSGNRSTPSVRGPSGSTRSPVMITWCSGRSQG